MNKMADMLVVKAKIKDYAKNMNVAGDFADELNNKVRDLIKAAVVRAQENGRKTVMAKDL
jgi:histone H3/H4